MRLAILVFLFGLALQVHGVTQTHCPEAFEKLAPSRKLYRPLLSTNAEALQSTKINTTFPAPNMFIYEPAKWLAPDREYKEQMAIRKALFKKRPTDILKIHPGQEQKVKEAAEEFLEMTASQLLTQFPSKFVKGNNSIKSLETGVEVSLDPKVGPHPLEKLGMLIQDDVTINLRTDEGKVILAGGFLATPTNWALQDFIGIKEPTITEANVGKNLFLRSELESIVNLPKSGATIFTIRPRVWDMEYVRENAPEVAKNLATAVQLPEAGYSETEWKEPLLKFFGVK